MTTEGAIILIWSVTLVIALVATVIAVLMIVRIVQSAREIDRLLKAALPAAGGIATNTAAIRELDAVVAAAGPLLDGSAAIRRASAGILDKVGRVGRLLSGAGGTA
ncbi:MAG: hypothetical protein U0893_20210 [Chloroflexota bacterium]